MYYSLVPVFNVVLKVGNGPGKGAGNEPGNEAIFIGEQPIPN